MNEENQKLFIFSNVDILGIGNYEKEPLLSGLKDKCTFLESPNCKMHIMEQLIFDILNLVRLGSCYISNL